MLSLGNTLAPSRKWAVISSRRTLKRTTNTTMTISHRLIGSPCFTTTTRRSSVVRGMYFAAFMSSPRGLLSMTSCKCKAIKTSSAQRQLHSKKESKRDYYYYLEMRRCAAAILYVEILAVTLLSQTSSRPVPAELDNSRDKRSSSAATDNFFEMSGISIITGNPSATGCKVVEQVKRNQTVWKVSANRTLQSSLQEVTQYVTKCCPGWNGTECNIAPPTTRPPSPTATTTRPPRPTATTTATALDPSNPCANLTCAGVDDAMCAVVTKCGRQIPLFVDSAGQLVDCPNSPTNINEITCCQNDPCAGNVSCSQHPEAVCFTTECCRPLWLLPSGVEVNCLLVDKRDTTADSGFSQ